MFDAMVNGHINTSDINFNITIKDIEVLNRMALQCIPDLVKISYATYPLIKKDYQLLTSGGAIGFGNGPLLVSKNRINLQELRNYTIAVPGEHTTANLLLSALFTDGFSTKPALFSDIEEMVLNNKVDAGVLIHETRFTYENKGLIKIADLGELWEKETGLPIPLGAIAVKRSLPQKIKSHINNLLRESIEYAMSNPDTSKPFVKKHAKSMNETVCNSHINLFVNRFSVNLGEQGKKAVTTLFERSVKITGKHTSESLPVFIETV